MAGLLEYTDGRFVSGAGGIANKARGQVFGGETTELTLGMTRDRLFGQRENALLRGVGFEAAKVAAGVARLGPPGSTMT